MEPVKGSDCRKARAERLARMWGRYVAASGFPGDPHLTDNQKRHILRAAIAGGLELGLLVTNALEAADLEISKDFEPPLPAEPTEALPGTMAKIQVLAERAEAGRQLFAPSDGPFLESWERESGR